MTTSRRSHRIAALEEATAEAGALIHLERATGLGRDEWDALTADELNQVLRLAQVLMDAGARDGRKAPLGTIARWAEEEQRLGMPVPDATVTELRAIVEGEPKDGAVLHRRARRGP